MPLAYMPCKQVHAYFPPLPSRSEQVCLASSDLLPTHLALAGTPCCYLLSGHTCFQHWQCSHAGRMTPAWTFQQPQRGKCTLLCWSGLLGRSAVLSSPFYQTHPPSPPRRPPWGVLRSKAHSMGKPDHAAKAQPVLLSLSSVCEIDPLLVHVYQFYTLLDCSSLRC